MQVSGTMLNYNMELCKKNAFAPLGHVSLCIPKSKLSLMATKPNSHRVIRMESRLAFLPL